MKNNRRSFLKRGAALATAASSLPYFVPRSVLGMAGTPSANEQIVLGVVGLGIRGTQLIGNILKLPKQCCIAAICDVDSQRIADTLKNNNADWKSYEDYRKLIEQKGLDGVVLCVPHHHHILPAILACQAGLDVYVEKPLSLYVCEGRALVNAARKHKRVVQVGSQQRTMEMDRFACELVRDGGIGKVKSVEAYNFDGPMLYPTPGLPEEAIPKTLNWDLFQGQAPAHPFNSKLIRWIDWRCYSGYATTDMGAHAYDMIQFALGMDDTGPVEYWPVEGQGRAARVYFRYANGIEVHLKDRGPLLGAVFVGEKCKIEINRNKFKTNPMGFAKNPPAPALAKKWEGNGFVAKDHIANWCDCIRSRAKPNADVEIGHRTVTIGHLINITRELNRKLRWDPVKEEVIDDPEANALLERPRRKGWELPLA
jgi:predicted dehydrogenase